MGCVILSDPADSCGGVSRASSINRRRSDPVIFVEAYNRSADKFTKAELEAIVTRAAALS